MGLNIDNIPPPITDGSDTSTASKPSKAAVFGSVLGAVARGAANVLVPGLGIGLGQLGGGIAAQALGSSMPGLGSDVGQYLALQNQLQQQQIAFETVSTVLKIRADSSMSAIRNMVLK